MSHTSHSFAPVERQQPFRTLYMFDNKVRELVAVKVLYTSLLNINMVAFKVLPLGSYA
jgi:hypothetical protein